MLFVIFLQNVIYLSPLFLTDRHTTFIMHIFKIKIEELVNPMKVA